VSEAIGAATDALRAAGVESARLDAELLLAAATGWKRASLAAEPDREVTAEASRRFGGFVRRRIRREPVAYILGRKGFRRLDLEIDGRVLIPRPETELLVEVAVELQPRTVLDVGTGSGAIALAVADELPATQVTATDVSPDALAVAQANAGRLGLSARVAFFEAAPARHFDLVLANLPYVCEDEWPMLAPEIREYEPRGALVAGEDGLDALRGLLASAPDCSAIAFEVGAGQAVAVIGLVREAGFDDVAARRDLAGIDRVVLGRR
jgi:release factor glutamine methyltransferase